MGPGKADKENLKFGTISHILATGESLLIVTLVQRTFSERLGSAIYFYVKIIKIGPEMANRRHVEISDFPLLLSKMPT